MASSNCSVELPKVTNSISKPFSAKMPGSWATGGGGADGAGIPGQLQLARLTGLVGEGLPPCGPQHDRLGRGGAGAQEGPPVQATALARCGTSRRVQASAGVIGHELLHADSETGRSTT